MLNLKEKYIQEVMPAMQKRFGYASVFAVPRIGKVVVSAGVGRIKDNKADLEALTHILSMITGQRPVSRGARQSIASFKTRQGQVIGYMVTLRGRMMYDFLTRFVMVALPRSRDFRGIPLRNVDEAGNLNVGIHEHIIFPEIVGEDVRRLFGLEVSIVLDRVKSREEAVELYRLLGFPLKKS